MSKFNKDPKLGKSSHNNKESKEGEVLRYIREARKLSLKNVAIKLSLKAQQVDHFENGRKFYTKEDIDMFLKTYEFTMENFEVLMSLKVLNKQLVNHHILQIENQKISD
jgi:transcriptional regulator with XRE-family HTH domain